jgi:CRISPR-associated protein Csb2
MLALGIRYLTKYAVAANTTRQRAEWPPHPGRVFMAMAAAHFEGGAEARERAALEWLEAIPAPALRASDADERSMVEAYVPVNDTAGGITGRPRQPRSFPRTRPHEDCVYLIWNEEPAPEIRAALGSICSKVTRLGHSISAVQMWVVERGCEPEANWVPEPGGKEFRLRVTSSGTLRSLDSAFNGAAIEAYDGLAEAMAGAGGKEKARLKKEIAARFPGGRPQWRRPQLVNWAGYARPAAQEDGRRFVDGPFDENFVVLSCVEGAALGLESTLQLTGALRNAAMKAAKKPPEWLSGHGDTGGPSLLPHVAFFPLPYVGFEHSDGHVLGLGMAIPKEIRPEFGGRRDEELRRVLGPLFFDPDSGDERAIELRAKAWRWILEREKRERPPFTLQRQSWTQPSRTWASVTPVVLHHYPKKRDGDVERIVRDAFVSASLPEPECVEVRSVSAVQGAGQAMSVPPFEEGGPGLCRFQTHVRVRFREAVRGPMLVGRGRFRGYGLLRPLADGEGL